MFQLDFLVTAKLMQLVTDVVFEALDVLLVGTAIDISKKLNKNSDN